MVYLGNCDHDIHEQFCLVEEMIPQLRPGKLSNNSALAVLHYSRGRHDTTMVESSLDAFAWWNYSDSEFHSGSCIQYRAFGIVDGQNAAHD